MGEQSSAASPAHVTVDGRSAGDEPDAVTRGGAGAVRQTRPVPDDGSLTATSAVADEVPGVPSTRCSCRSTAVPS